MRVALVYPYAKRTHHQCSAPLALLYLATALRAKGVEAEVLDLDGYPDGLAGLVDDLVRRAPGLVGFPLFSELAFQERLRDVLPAVRERLPRARIVIGGPHPTACPEETLRDYPEADYVLRGEAELTLVELVQQLSGNAARPAAPGLAYRQNGGTVLLPAAPPPQDLDALPIPDRTLLWDNYRRRIYWRMGRGAPADLIITSRGCPFRCRFCFKVEESYRTRGAANVVGELEYLARLGITTVDIEDDLFTAKRPRCLEICRSIRDAGLRLDLKVRSHVRSVDEELLAEMKRAGVRAVVFGIESGSDRMLAAMNKKATAADNLRAIRLVKRAGLMCYADVFVGFPGETRETLAETRRFLARARPTAVQAGPFIPFPRTAAYSEAVGNGTLVGDWSADGPQPFVRLPWAATPADLSREVRRLVSWFYSRPAVLLGLARRILLRLDLAGWRGVFTYAAYYLKR
jgi:radical SAM superfamily enzyme YgiQ (UPF0313 family)